MAESIDAKKKSEADLAVKHQDERDKRIEEAIIGAFQGIKERLTVERINSIKDILNDIIEAQLEAQNKKQKLLLKELVDKIAEREITIDEKILFELLGVKDLEIKNDNFSDVTLPDGEIKAIYTKEFICGIDRILEEKKRKDVSSQLERQDKTVGNDFAVGVRTILEKKENTSGVKVNKYATSGAVLLGGTCLGTGIHLIVVAGSIAAAGTFPIGLAVIGGVLIIGTGIYYAKKKRERIAKFLPALYTKSKNTKDMRIVQLDGQERHKKLASLTKKYDEKNKRNNRLAEKKIASYKKKRQPEYNRIYTAIQDLKDELKIIKEMLEDPITDFKVFKEKYKSKLKNVNVDIQNASDLKSFKRKLLQRESTIKFGTFGDIEETFKKIHEMYSDIDSFSDFNEFKRKYDSEYSSNFEKIQSFTDLNSFKAHLKARGIQITWIRQTALVGINELKIDWEHDQEAYKRSVYADLEKQNKINAKKYKKDASLIESKAIKLRWYKQIAPYLAYWATNIAVNFRSNAVALRELTAVVEAGAAQTSKVLKEKGSDPSSIPEFQTVEKFAKDLENAREKFDERIGNVITQLSKELPDQNRTDFFDYLKIEECYASDKVFKEKIARLVSGDKIKNIMLRIFYTHPSTVLSLLDESTETTIDNINAALQEATDNLLKFPKESIFLDSLQVYFPPEDNPDYQRFMLVSSEKEQDSRKKEQKTTGEEALFEHVLAIKRSIMEVNKTLQAIPKVSKEELEEVKKRIQAKIAILIEAAIPALKKIEEQLEKLDVAQEANRYREAYLNVFRGFSDPDKLGECIEQANFSDVVLLLDSNQLKEFARSLENKEKSGILKEFFEIFNSELNNPNFEIPHATRLEFFQKVKAVGEKDKQLVILQEAYQKFAKRQRFSLTNLHKLNGKTFTGDEDLQKYIKNNEHIYFSQAVLIEQKRGVLEEMQKSLVLSIPEIETTLERAPTYEFRRIAKKRRVTYGVPYNPSMSFSMDYISDLFKIPQFAFGEMEKILFNFKFPEMTIKSISVDLTKILDLVGDKNIPISIDNVWKILVKMKEIKFPGFNDIFGSIFGRVEAVKSMLNSKNQEKIVFAIKGFRDFLANIPAPFKDWTFPDLIAKIREMSLEIGELSIQLSDLQRRPYSYNNALEMKKIILRLKTLKVDFDTLNINLGDIDLKNLVRDLPDGFPFKSELGDFALSFDPFFSSLKEMGRHFEKIKFLGNFPFDDFLYVCNCFKEFGGFKKIMMAFPEWLKKYAEYEKEISDMEKGRKQMDKSRYGYLKIELDKLKINFEKFKNLKIHVGNLGKFAAEASSFEFPDFLALPGLPKFSSATLQSLSADFDKFGGFSFEDISFIINFLDQFKGIEGVKLELPKLMGTIIDLKFEFDLLKNLKNIDNEKKLKELKEKLEIATKKFDMFNDFNLRIGKFLGVFAKFPELNLAGISGIDFSSFKPEECLDTMRGSVKAMNVSIDFYSGMSNIKNSFSGWNTKGLRLEMNINSLWPSFSKEKQKKTKNKTDSSSKFNVNFGDIDINLNLKAVDLDEVIRQLEALRMLNIKTKAEITGALDKLHEPAVEQVEQQLKVKEKIKAVVGFDADELEMEFRKNLNMVSGEINKDLVLTLKSLYTLKAVIAVTNAIKRGDGQKVVMELADLLTKVPTLNNDIRLTIDEINMLQEFGTGTEPELEKIEMLKQRLALKEQELRNIKLNLSELKRLKEAFELKDINGERWDPKKVINYEEPPISDMMDTFEVDKGTIEDIMEQAKNLATDTVDAALIAVQISEMTIKLVPFVNVIKNIEDRNIKAELEALIQQAISLSKESKSSADKPIENSKEKLLQLNNIKKKLLDLKQLTNMVSEISDFDFAKPPYSDMLQPLGFSGDKIKSAIENVKSSIQGDSIVGIDDALRGLEIAETGFKISFLNENIGVIKKCFAEHNLLKFLNLSTHTSDLDSIVEQWKNSDSHYSSLNFLELRNAVKNVENLLNEFDEISKESGSLNQSLQEKREVLNSFLGVKSNQEVNNLFSNIYEITSIAAIVHAQAKGGELEAVFEGLAGMKLDDSSQVLIEPAEFIKRHKGVVDELVASNKALMEKFHDYHSLIRIVNQLKIKLDSSGGKLETADVDVLARFKELRLEIMGLEKEVNIFLRYKELVTELLENVSLPEAKNDSSVELKEDSNVANVRKLKNFLNIVDNFYILNNAQMIHQNLEFVDSVYQRIQAYEADQSIAHHKQVLPHFRKQESKREVEGGPKKKPKQKLDLD